jgi:hypothetical protein
LQFHKIDKERAHKTISKAGGNACDNRNDAEGMVRYLAGRAADW